MNYGTIGKVGFGLFAGQYSHMNELSVASTISTRLVLRRLKAIGREQVVHVGHGLYMAAPWASCSRTQAVSRDEEIKEAPWRVPLGSGGKTASEYLHRVYEIERRNLGAQSATESGRCRRDC